MNPYKLYQNAIRSKRFGWLTIALTILYIISPVDLLPEVLVPFLGPLVIIDDGVILTIFITELLRMSRERKLPKKQNNQDHPEPQPRVVDAQEPR